MEPDQKKNALGLASVIGAALFFSLNTPLARLAYDGGSTPETVVFLRVVLCVIGIALFIILTGRRIALPRAAVLPMIGVAVFIVLQGMAYLTSIAYIPVGLAALLFYTFPLMVAVASRIVDGVPLGNVRIVAFAAAFIGIALAIGPSFDVLDGRGIALALLHHAFREFKKRGQQRVGLGVDATSLTGANRLYEEAGMKPTRQINVFEKELRSGVDLSLRTLAEGDVES